jgi:hypothetical protein
VEPASGRTDAAGHVSARWTLGQDGGPDSLFVSPFPGDAYDAVAIAHVTVP